MKVDFIIIGAQKCATSSLAAQLAQQPAICFCSIKEPHFFSYCQDWEKHLKGYHALFAPGANQITGEASTSYTFFPEHPHMASNLYSYNPDLKLIYIMRDPIDRIISHYAHRAITGREKKPIDRTVLENPIYVNRSRYGVQLRTYLRFFPREQLLPLIFEEYIQNPDVISPTLASFLGITISPGCVSKVTPQNVSLQRRMPKQFLRGSPMRQIMAFFSTRWRSKMPGFLFERWTKTPEIGPDLAQQLGPLLEDDVTFVENLISHRLDKWRGQRQT